MIHVEQPGLLTTVQDLGRPGYQRYGVVVAGAMDAVALQVGNLLVGNRPGAAALEMTLTGPRLSFADDALVAVTGLGLMPMVDGREVPRWRPVFVAAGSTLSFRPMAEGCRSYLAVAGGVDVPVVMGSRSTYLRAGMGGFQGRALQAGDEIQWGERSSVAEAALAHLRRSGSGSAAAWFPAPSVLPAYRAEPVIRVLPGRHTELFTEESRKAFTSQWFQLTSQSDRMGYRLQGPTLHLANPVDLLSEAVTAGTVQVPTDGNPILLMADRQTTGGYPKMAQVASVDLPVLAQLRPGSRIRFEWLALADATRLLRAQQQELAAFARGLHVAAQAVRAH
ncbi:MAG: biotin-dependent carboxyltransferase family protein [Alicyclobacillus sp.]|nr:biotin-dependent carboxyltransferase family protein [Alicyclobacillus sp.]